MTANHGPLLKARGSTSGPPSLNPLIMPPKRPDGFNNQSMSGMNSSPIGSQVSFHFLFLCCCFFFANKKVGVYVTPRWINTGCFLFCYVSYFLYRFVFIWNMRSVMLIQCEVQVASILITILHTSRSKTFPVCFLYLFIIECVFFLSF